MSMKYFDYLKALFLLNRIKKQVGLYVKKNNEKDHDPLKDIGEVLVLEFPKEFHDSLIGEYIDDINNLTLLLANWTFYVKAGAGKNYKWVDHNVWLRIRENDCLLELPAMTDNGTEANRSIIISDWRNAIVQFAEFIEKVNPDKLKDLIFLTTN